MVGCKCKQNREFQTEKPISNLNENWHEGKVLIEQQNAYIVFVVHTSGLGRY